MLNGGPCEGGFKIQVFIPLLARTIQQLKKNWSPVCWIQQYTVHARTRGCTLEKTGKCSGAGQCCNPCKGTRQVAAKRLRILSQAQKAENPLKKVKCRHIYPATDNYSKYTNIITDCVSPQKYPGTVSLHCPLVKQSVRMRNDTWPAWKQKSPVTLLPALRIDLVERNHPEQSKNKIKPNNMDPEK